MEALGSSPRVFISYSHGSVEHEQRVRDLVMKLKAIGFSCSWDQDGDHGMRWPHWMTDEIDKADFVLVICNKAYRDRSRATTPSGVQWEGALIVQRLYSGGAVNHRFIPVVLTEEDREYIPSAFAGYDYFDLTRPRRWDDLVRRLGSQRGRGAWRPVVDPKRRAVIYPDGRDVPFLAPIRVEPLHGRRNQLAAIKQRVLEHARPQHVAICGAAGVGKTAIAVALAHDPDLLERFSDGVMWTSLGKRQHCDLALAEWSAALGIVVNQGDTIDKQAVRDALAQRHMLVVIDNALEKRVLRYFDQLIQPQGKSCVIITAPSIEAERDLGPRAKRSIKRTPPRQMRFHVEWVNSLAEPDALALLRTRCPTVARADDLLGEARIACGRPLALELAGSYRNANFPPAAPQSGLEHGRGGGSARRNGHVNGNRSPGATALQRCIRLCYDAVRPDARHALLSLSVFPARPNTFSEQAARFVAGTKNHSTLEELLAYGLLEQPTRGRYAIHQAIRKFVLREAPNHEALDRAHRRMIQYYTEFAHDNARRYRTLRDESRNMLAMLLEAEDRRRWLPLLHAMQALWSFFETQGLYCLPEIPRFLNALRDDAAGARRQLAPHQELDVCLLMAKRAEKLGDYDKAKALLEPFLADLPESRRCDVLLTLGVVEFNRCDYDKAREHLDHAYETAKKQHEREQICRVLERICLVAVYKGCNDDARRIAQEARALTKGNRSRSPLARALLRLACGRIELIDNRYSRAATLARRGLLAASAEAVGPEVEAALLQVQARAVLGDNPDHARCVEAEHLLKRAIDLAHGIGHRWYHSYLQYELGKVHLRDGDLDRAAQAFEHAAQTAEEIRSRDLLAFSLYGRANVARRRFMPVLADRLGEQSLVLFDEIKHFKRTAVRTMLAELRLEIGRRHRERDEPEEATKWFASAVDAARHDDSDNKQLHKLLLQARKEFELAATAAKQKELANIEKVATEHAAAAATARVKRITIDVSRATAAIQPAASLPAASSSSSSQRRRRTGRRRRGGRGFLRGDIAR